MTLLRHGRRGSQLIRMLITGCVLVALVGTVHAGTATLSWTPPTQNTDGSDLIDLAGCRLYYGTETGNYAQTIEIADPDATTYVVENLDPGTWYFVSTAYNASGVESAYSNEASKTVADNTPPEPPSGLIVVPDNLYVYGLSQTNNRLVLYPVGTVPENTPCDNTMSANGHYRVDREFVAWAGNVEPAVVVALCSGD